MEDVIAQIIAVNPSPDEEPLAGLFRRLHAAGDEKGCAAIRRHLDTDRHLAKAMLIFARRDMETATDALASATEIETAARQLEKVVAAIAKTPRPAPETET